MYRWHAAGTDTERLRRVEDSPSLEDLTHFGAYVASSAEAREALLRALATIPSPSHSNKRLWAAIRRIHEELARSSTERAGSRRWYFEDDREERWLEHLSRVQSDDVVIMASAYLSLSEERQHRFLQLCTFNPALPPKVREFAAAVRSLRTRDAALKSEGTFSRRSLFKSAALLACSVGLEGVGIALSGHSRRRGWHNYATAVGEHKKLRLPDGSAFELNTTSRLRFKAFENHRIAELIAGEAWFHPATDRDRRFVVFAGKIAVLDIGTQYSVRVRESGEVQVMVSDGEVLLTPQVRQGPIQRLIRGRTLGYETGGVSVPAGHLATSQQGGHTAQPISPGEIERREAWRDEKVIFDNTPMARAVEEVNRYNHRQIYIVDPSIATVGVNGTFSTQRGQIRFLQALTYNKNVRYTTVGSGDAVRFELSGTSREGAAK
jgi:transmembrane sensor